MATTSDEDGLIEDIKPSAKSENEQRLLDSIPRQSTIAQFIKSGRAAFGSVDTKLLQDRNAATGEVQKWMLDGVRERLAAASDLYHDDILIVRSLLKLDFSANKTGYQHLQTELSRLMRSNLTYAAAFAKSVHNASIKEVPQNVKDEVIRDVAQELGQVCIDMRDYEIVEGQLEKGEKAVSSEPYPVAKISATELSEFTKELYGLGLYKPVESMLAKLRSEMNHAPTTDLHIIYVPFLQELIGLMLMYGIPFTNVVYSAFFESVLKNYLQRFVGEEPKRMDSAEHNAWIPRAAAARHRLESFDHFYFRDILGDRYAVAILPAIMKLQEPDPVPQGQILSGLPTTSSTSGA